MQAYRVLSGRGREALERVDLEPSELSPHEVRIRVHAVALNYRDLMIAQGNYPVSTDRPPIAVADGAGEVTDLGDAVTRFKIGDRVTRTYFSEWFDGPPTFGNTAIVPGASVDGMLAEQVSVHEDHLVAVPPHLSYQEAASLSCAGVTAWNALFVEGRVQPGNTVLLLGTGGVSIWALQLAKAAGLRAIITSSSDEKLERARKLGADEVINYRTIPEWHEEVLRMTGGTGVDLTLEIGGRETLNRSVAATRLGGIVVLIGGVNGFTAQLDIVPLLVGHKHLIGIAVGSRAMFEALNRFVSLTGIKPAVDRVFPFEQAREALLYLEGAGHLGKVIIDLEH